MYVQNGFGMLRCHQGSWSEPGSEGGQSDPTQATAPGVHPGQEFFF